MNPSTFIVTGHVDHGKSTFIGRLLLETGAIPRDRFENIKKTGRFEYAHLTDALAAEREKGITIGVSQTPLTYNGRDFLLLDAPGHFEFLQNMITGAARADTAFFVVDAQEGLKESSLRHLNMLSFLDVPRVIVLINKMDLVNYSEDVYTGLKTAVGAHFTRLGLAPGPVIPVAAYEGENLVRLSPKMPWYKGATALSALTEQSPAADAEAKADENFTFVVHDVYGSSVVGETLSGNLQNGIYHCFQSTRPVEVKLNPEHYRGSSHHSFETSADLKRGDLVVERRESLRLGGFLEVNMIWFSDLTLVPGEWIQLRVAKQEVQARITSILSLADSASLENPDVNQGIRKGFVAKCLIETQTPVAFSSFKKNIRLGRFVLLKNGLISGAGKII